MLRHTKNGQIYDTRAPKDKIFISPLSVCYTYLDDDITKTERPSATPYQDRADTLIYTKNGEYISKSHRNKMTIIEYRGGLLIDLAPCDSEYERSVSEYGINLPFNFMGKLDGGGWSNQFLFNSPYMSSDDSYIYAYLTKPNGKNLLLAVLSDAQGWKMDYSPYSWGHYFSNLKILSRYDKAFGEPTDKPSHIKLALMPVDDFDNALSVLSALYDAPVLTSELSGGKIGDTIMLNCFGEADTIIEASNGESRAYPYTQSYTIHCEGEVELTPQRCGKRGVGITLYGYESLRSLYEKSMDSISLEIVRNHTDGNLCEHQCWVSAMLRFLQKYAHTLAPLKKERYEALVLEELNIITEENVERATPHQTILKTPHERFGAYNVYKSCRVQELFFGITILLDAYRYFGDEKYYEYALGATNCLLDNYRGANGEILVDWGDGTSEDYTTVCAPMIPLANMTELLKGKDEAQYQKCREACDKMAHFLFLRGLHFPTEGEKSAFAEEEMEDGSISCTALCLLYYCKHIRYDEAYIKKAREILDIHESWVIKSQICQMKGSSLRWWETQWEGDADGPAICAGHAWSIWRAEADYLYYTLTGDEVYLIKAKNGFMTNLSKIQADGKTYSTYNPDRINGGGFGKPMLKIASRFASVEDCGISRYVWIRINETFLQE
ncbi:MAG: hypothetical protein IJF11_03245 [Clostridia bacterium]|nr:hypothetical protein [Clostridia bacterium]